MTETEKNYIEANILLAVSDRQRHSYNMKTGVAVGNNVSVKTRFHEGRNVPGLTLDEASFELVSCPTALSTSDFYKLQAGNEEIKDRYYSEVSDFLKKKLGCDKAVCIHSQVRNSDKSGTDGIQDYAGLAPHTDSSPTSADAAALEVLRLKGEKPDLYQRYLYVNLWRNIDKEPIQNDHLAMLDERTTVKPDDYLPKDLHMDHNISIEQYGLNARNAKHHRWYYFDKMTQDEAILFKQMDSDWRKNSRICFHQSVNDASRTNTTVRASIEVRILCFWKQAGLNTMPEVGGTEARQAALVNTRSLETASFGQLVFALVNRMFLGLPAFVFTGFSTNRNTYSPPEPYTGDPADYVERFYNAVNYYGMWPSWAKMAVKIQIQSASDFDTAIVSFTKGIVNDTGRYQKTNHLTAEEKAAIVKCLLSNERYLQVCKRKLGGFARA